MKGEEDIRFVSLVEVFLNAQSLKTETFPKYQWMVLLSWYELVNSSCMSISTITMTSADQTASPTIAGPISSEKGELKLGRRLILKDTPRVQPLPSDQLPCDVAVHSFKDGGIV